MKKDFKIKLIFSPSFEGFGMFSPPLGQTTLVSYLRMNGYYVDQDDLLAKVNYRNHRGMDKGGGKKFNLNLIFEKYADYVQYITNSKKYDKLDEMFERILALTEYKSYDVIGFSVHSIFQFLSSLVLAKKVKERTGAVIVFGGPLITNIGSLLFSRFGFIDYMVVGDGEIPFLRLIEHLQMGGYEKEDIPGLVYRDLDRIRLNKGEQLSIDEVPPPDFDGLPLEAYPGLLIPYQIKKGCNNRCSFCTHYVTVDGLQIKPVEKVVKELGYLVRKYDSNWFYFCDSTFNTTYEHTEELCDALIKSNLGIKWIGLARTNNLDARLIKKIRLSGCSRMKWGIESGSDKITGNINKGFNNALSSQILKNTAGTGILNDIFIMVGYPHETEEDIAETIRFIKKNASYINKVICTIFSLEHNSLICKYPKKYNLTNLHFITNSFFEADSNIFPEDLTDFRKEYSFDEIGGLKWADKKAQQKNREKFITTFANKFVKKHKYGKRWHL